MLKDPVYTIALGVPAEMLGWALSIPRAIDAFFDPMVGYVSDNWKGRWGRRRPFILASALPLGILGFLVWTPSREWSTSMLTWYFLGVTMLFYLAYSIFIVPYRALGLELTTDYNERTRVQGWGMLVGLLGGLGLPWLYKLSLMLGGGSAHDPKVSADVILAGVKWVGLGVAVLLVLTCAAPAFFCREKSLVSSAEKITVRRAVVETFRNRPFLHMIGMNFFGIIAVFTPGTAMLIINIYHLFGGNQDAAATLGGYSGMATVAGAFIGVPVNTWISTRIGKHRAALVCLGVGAVAFGSFWFTFNVQQPYWTILSNFLIGWGMQGVWLMTATMNADVCDEDELRTGHRREGLYGAVFALEQKLALAFGALVGGYVVRGCGYIPGTTPGAEVLYNLRLSIVTAPVIAIGIAALIIAFYPLTRERLTAIREKLHARTSSHLP